MADDTSNTANAVDIPLRDQSITSEGCLRLVLYPLLPAQRSTSSHTVMFIIHRYSLLLVITRKARDLTDTRPSIPSDLHRVLREYHQAIESLHQRALTVLTHIVATRRDSRLRPRLGQPGIQFDDRLVGRREVLESRLARFLRREVVWIIAW